MSDDPSSSHVQVAVAVEAEDWSARLPEAATLAERAAREAVRAVFPALAANAGQPVEIAVVLADDATLRRLNRDYRDIDAATNVLSFGDLEAGDAALAAKPPGEPLALGDVLLALETVERESSEQLKPLAHHLCHLVVHGVLHLLGYDHQDDTEAAEMEGLEAAVLRTLGVPDPYAGERPAAAPRPGARRG